MAKHIWLVRTGTYFFASVDGTGAIQKTLGVVASIDSGQVVACIPTRFDSYKVFDEAPEGKLYVEALTALEQEVSNNDDDDE